MLKEKPFLFLESKYIVLLIFIISSLIFILALFQMKNVSTSVKRISKERGVSLTETISQSSEFAFFTFNKVEEEIISRVFLTARLVSYLEEKERLSDGTLRLIAKENEIHQINIYDSQGALEISSEISLAEKELPQKLLIDAEENEILLELDVDPLGRPNSFAAVRKRKGNRGFIVVKNSPEELIKLRKKIGMGKLVQELSFQRGVEYIVIQDKGGIISASSNVRKMSSFLEDEFLIKTINTQEVKDRIVEFKGEKILEIVKPVKEESGDWGVFRVGISLEDYHAVLKDSYKFILRISFIILIIALLGINFTVVNQNYALWKKAYQVISTYANVVVENITSGVLVGDNNEKISLFNKNLEKTLGISLQKGQDYNQIFPKDEFKIKEALHSKRAIYDLELNYKNKDLMVNTSLLWREGKIDGAVALINDITEFNKMKKKIELASRISSLGKMAASVAHEIRNPLNAISLTLQRLKKYVAADLDREKTYELTGTVEKEIKRLNKIVSDFLELSKPKQITFTGCNINEIIEETLSFLNEKFNAFGIKINKTLQPLSSLNGNKEELRKAVLNIILNAIEAMEKTPLKELSIYTNEQRIENQEGKVKIIEMKIKDTGEGIPKENISKIFEPYFTTKESGLGIGLTTVYRIVNEHGGEIYFESEINKGTEVTVLFPIGGKNE